MPLNDYQLALQCQQQYDGKMLLKTVAKVDYSIVHNDDAIDLIFQGTSNLDDAKRDLEALMIDIGWGRVHAGAWYGLTEVIDTEGGNLSNVEHIRLSGHSLGAMEAQMVKRILFQRGYRNLTCVTFESPHWGDHAAVGYSGNANERTYQNYKDLFEHDMFTLIPPHLFIEPYAAVANCTRFWRAPTTSNEWKGAPLNIQAHSLGDCVIPFLKEKFGG